MLRPQISDRIGQSERRILSSVYPSSLFPPQPALTGGFHDAYRCSFKQIICVAGEER
jgi:hypothetical protein